EALEKRVVCALRAVAGACAGAIEAGAAGTLPRRGKCAGSGRSSPSLGWGKQFGKRCNAAVVNRNDIDQLGHYRLAAEPRENLNAPMNGCVRTINQQGEDFQIIELEALDHDGKQGPQLVTAVRRHREKAGIARTRDAEPGVKAERVANAGKITAQSRRIQ